MRCGGAEVCDRKVKWVDQSLARSCLKVEGGKDRKRQYWSNEMDSISTGTGGGGGGGLGLIGDTKKDQWWRAGGGGGEEPHSIFGVGALQSSVSYLKHAGDEKKKEKEKTCIAIQLTAQLQRRLSQAHMVPWLGTRLMYTLVKGQLPKASPLWDISVVRL